MERSEAEASFRILVAVARADGHVAVDEERALAILARFDATADISGQIDVEKEAEKIRSVDVRRATFDAALALASVDGRCTEEEHALLVRLRAALAIEDCPDLAVAEAAWIETMQDPLAEIEGLELEFLRTISLKRDEMTDKEYAALVSQFGAKRSRVLAEALSTATIT
jgi:tellurite resistance protein